MKVLLVHNRYQQRGGEDVAFEGERELLSANGNIVDELVFDNKEIRTPMDKLLSGIGTLYNPRSARMLEDKILAFRPNVVHVHNFFPLASPSIFYVPRQYHVPVVLTLHNYRLICPSATMFHNQQIYERSMHSVIPFDAVMKGVYRGSRLQTASVAAMLAIHNMIGTWRNKVDKYIVLTRFSQQKFENSTLRIPGRKFMIKSNFVKDPGDGISKREDFFLYVSRLSPEKGVHTVLEAARIHKFNLTIIGDGPLRPLVEECVRNNPHVTYIGFQPKQVVIDHLKRCKAMLFPSQCYDIYPLTLLEALSTGTPVIAAAVEGAVQEIIEDNVNGLHFKPGNAQDLVQKIILFTQQQELAVLLAQNARRSYLKRYTPEKNYSILKNIYKQAILEARH